MKLPENPHRFLLRNANSLVDKDGYPVFISAFNSTTVWASMTGSFCAGEKDTEYSYADFFPLVKRFQF